MKIRIEIDTEKDDKPTVEVLDDAKDEREVTTEATDNIPLQDFSPDLSKPVRMKVVEDEETGTTTITEVEDDGNEGKVSKNPKR